MYPREHERVKGEFFFFQVCFLGYPGTRSLVIWATLMQSSANNMPCPCCSLGTRIYGWVEKHVYFWGFSDLEVGKRPQ